MFVLQGPLRYYSSTHLKPTSRFMLLSCRYPALMAYLVPRFNVVTRAVFVVPHFDILRCNTGLTASGAADEATVTSRIPATHSELESALATGEVVPFHTRPELLIPGLAEPTDLCYGFPRNRSWPQGVAATNYSRWYYESSRQWRGFIRLDRSWMPETYFEKFWEPFLIARKVEPGKSRRLPRYSESYVGRYRNKVSWVALLRAQRYKFFTVLREFVVHAPHTSANASAVASKVHV